MKSDARPVPETVEDLQQRQRFIGKEIRKYFDDAVNEEVPQHLLDLLNSLDNKKDRDGSA